MILEVLSTGSISFIITFLAIPVIILIADQKKLFDVPDKRKIHTKLVPSLGGVGIFGGFMLGALLFISSAKNPEFQYFYAAAVVTFFLGLKDDVIILSASKKFVGQLMAAAIIIQLGGVHLDSMHGVFGINELPAYISYPLSYLTVIVIINSFNLIDGVDGLAGSLGLLSLGTFAIYFYFAGVTAYAQLAVAMMGSLIAFLIFNYHPAKIFMGDSGSLLVGLINSILVIKFIQVADAPQAALPVASAVAVGFAILMLPLFDTLRVFGVRLSKGTSPFTPDRNHLHHLLLDRGLRHPAVTLTCLVVNILFIAVAYFSRSIGPTYLLLSMLLLAVAGVAFLYFGRPRPKPSTVKTPVQRNIGFDKQESIAGPKVVTVSNEEPVVLEN